jgi:solute carrier family 45 protein 1/2/4
MGRQIVNFSLFTEDHARILSTSTILGGLGGTIGYLLGSVNWEQTSLGASLGGSVNTVFTMVTGLFVLGMLFSLTSIREIPRPFLKRHGLLKPATLSMICESENKNQWTELPPKVEDVSEKPLFIVDFLKGIFCMPKPMKILVLTNLLSWMGYLSFCLYYTTFVGEVIFGGDPTVSQIPFLNSKF